MDGTVGIASPLPLVLSDGATGFYPQAQVYFAGSVVATVPLTYVAGSQGLYQGTWTPAEAGDHPVVYTVYSDAGHTTVATSGGQPLYNFTQDIYQISSASTAVTTASVRQSVTLTASAIIVNVWAEVNGLQLVSGLTNANLTLYDALGNVLVTASQISSPSATGVFQFSLTPPSFGIGENATYTVATVLYNLQTLRGVTGVTFSRAS